MKPSQFLKKRRTTWILVGAVLTLGIVSEVLAFSNEQSGARHFKTRKGIGLFHYDRKKQESWLKGAMWKQYKKVPISKSDYAPENLTFLNDEETIEILAKEIYTTKRTTTNNYYEEGGVGYVTLPNEIPSHTLTMYKVKVLTGKAAGKEGWIYKDSLGSRTKKPNVQTRASVDHPKPDTSTSEPKSIYKKGLFLVKLKSGQSLVSSLYKERDGTVTLMKGGKILKYNKDEIQSVKNLR